MSVATGAVEPGREVEWGFPDWEELRARPERVRSALALVRGAVSQDDGPFSFRAAMGSVSGGALSLRERVGVRGNLASAALLNAIRRRSAADATTATAALAGLGEGSTPAGDDFLVGVIYAIYATLPRARAAALGTAIAAAAAARTTRLSALCLQRAAGGEAIPTWSHFFSAVATGETRRIRERARRVAALGHTSGRAALAGFAAAVDALVGGTA
jgi:hypothetical protein